MKDNRGFTLIELIVVMVIMGIIAIGSMVGYNMLGSGSAQSTAQRISSMLDYVQLENMTKNKTYIMAISQNNVGNYILSVEEESSPNNIVISREKLELKNGEITFRYSGEITENLISFNPAVRLEVSFDKSTGGFKQISGKTITKIGLSASGRSYSILLVEVTGKHYIE